MAPGKHLKNVLDCPTHRMSIACFCRHPTMCHITMPGTTTLVPHILQCTTSQWLGLLHWYQTSYNVPHHNGWDYYTGTRHPTMCHITMAGTTTLVPHILQCATSQWLGLLHWYQTSYNVPQWLGLLHWYQTSYNVPHHNAWDYYTGTRHPTMCHITMPGTTGTLLFYSSHLGLKVKW